MVHYSKRLPGCSNGTGRAARCVANHAGSAFRAEPDDGRVNAKSLLNSAPAAPNDGPGAPRASHFYIKFMTKNIKNDTARNTRNASPRRGSKGAHFQPLRGNASRRHGAPQKGGDRHGIHRLRHLASPLTSVAALDDSLGTRQWHEGISHLDASNAALCNKQRGPRSGREGSRGGRGARSL